MNIIDSVINKINRSDIDIDRYIEDDKSLNESKTIMDELQKYGDTSIGVDEKLDNMSGSLKCKNPQRLSEKLQRYAN